MPSKRAIILDRLASADTAYRVVMWSDVPAGNQIAYANPNATSKYENITPTELQAIRDGAVKEKEITYVANSGATLAQVRAGIDAEWAAFQSATTAETVWSQYGGYSDSGGSWQSATGVPACSLKEYPEGLPTFRAITPVSALGSNKFHFVLYNNAPVATSQSLVVKVRQIVVQPGTAAVTGAASSVWTVNRRNAPATPPSGAGSVTPFLFDSAQAIPASIGIWNAPGTSPAGGTTSLFLEFLPQADELKLSTADSPTLAAVNSEFAGQVIYNAAKLDPCRPLVIRPAQTLEIQQGATAGTGNCRVIVDFTVG